MSDGEGADVVAAGDRAVEGPASRALGYGKRALHAVLDAVEVPDTREAEHVRSARAQWTSLLPELPASGWMRRVRIRDLRTHPFRAMRDFEISAWVNSTRDMYVGPVSLPEDAGVSPSAYWRALLFHESLHVVQFRAAFGRPPSSYATMMSYECQAYRRTADWLEDVRFNPDRGGGLDVLIDVMGRSADLFCNEITLVEQEHADEDARDVEYRRFLLQERFLPPHDEIAELYGR